MTFIFVRIFLLMFVRLILDVFLGLRFEDLYDPKEDLDIKEAMNRLPREIVDARNQRLKRAMDLSMKHEYLPEDLQVYMCIIYLYMYVFCYLLSINTFSFSKICVLWKMLNFQR